MSELLPVTVVIPAKNRELLLPRALDSVARQTRPPVEVIVIDDGSSDRTAEVAGAAGATVIRQEQSTGSGPARNAGLWAAGTEWVALLDSDDEWHPDHLARLWPHRGAYAFVTTACLGVPSGRVRGRVQPWGRDLAPGDLFWPENTVCTSGVLLNVAAAKQVDGFRPLARAQDLDLWIRLLESGRGRTTGAVTVTYHEHEGQHTADLGPTLATVDRLLADQEGASWQDARFRRRIEVRNAWDARQQPGAVPIARADWPTLLPVLLYRRAAALRGRFAVRRRSFTGRSAG